MADIRVIETKTIDLDEMRVEAAGLRTLAKQIKFVITKERLSEEIAALVERENSEREMKISELNNDAKLLEEEIEKYG